jgi:hypothetical protein
VVPEQERERAEDDGHEQRLDPLAARAATRTVDDARSVPDVDLREACIDGVSARHVLCVSGHGS